MPITKDDQQGRLRLGQGLNKASLPQVPQVVPHPNPSVPHIQSPPPSGRVPLPMSLGAPPPAPAPLATAPPPRRLPALSPSGFAVDLTPKGKKADLTGRGAAMLMRGNLAKQLVDKHFGADLGPGEKHALATLHSPQDLYDPKNKESLAAIMRPGPVMQRAIDINPELKRNQTAILGRLQDVGTGQVKGSSNEKSAIADYLGQHGMTVEQWKAAGQDNAPQQATQLPPTAGETRPWDPNAEQQLGLTKGLRTTPVRTTLPPTSGSGAEAAAKAHSIEMEPGIPPADLAAAREASLGTGIPGIMQNFVTGGAKTAIGFGPGMINLATHDPRQTLPELGKAIVKDYAGFRHPLRKMQQDPFGSLMDALGVGSLAGGAAARAGAVGKALGRAEVAAGPIEQAGVDGLKINEMRSMARDRGLSTTGKKADLHARLVEHERTAADAGKTGPDIKEAARSLVWGPRAGAQVIEHNGVRVVVPYSKSALGRGIQRARIGGLKVGGRTIVPGLLDRLDHPSNLLNDTMDKVHENAPPLRAVSNVVGAEGKFGRMVAKQGRLQQDQNSAMGTYLLGRHAGPTLPATAYNRLFNKGEDVSALRPSVRGDRMTAEQQKAIQPHANNLIALARGVYTHDRHGELWSAGQPTKEGLRDPVAINVPKAGQKLKASSWDSESKAAQNFERLITQGAEKKAKVNPDQVRYVERGMLNAIHPFDPSKVGKGMRGLDWAQSTIRAGRFLHPGYLGWAVQNGILHASQAGMFGLRNAWQLHNHFDQLPTELKAQMESDVGAGVAHATSGEHEMPVLRKTINKLGAFWHNVDDRPFRLMSLYHEMNREGFHTLEEQKALYTDPKNADIRQAIAHRARNEAIDYSAMTPAERHYLKAAFTAWGWTRGASAWAMRFPLEHPVQAQAATAIGHEGSQMTDQYYAQHGGMPPSWLEAGHAITGGKSPWIMQSGLFNPAETLGRFAGEIPGARYGSASSLASEVSPPLQGALEGLTGRDQFGNQLRGWDRVSRPIGDTLKRFEPLGVYDTVNKKTGSTVGGLEGAAVKYAGLPLVHIRDIDKTAALGQKDFEQAISKGDLINFRAQDHIDRIPREVALFQKKFGHAPSQAMIGRYKGAVDTVEHIQNYQLHYASQKGFKSYKSLPAQNKVEAAINYIKSATHVPAHEVAAMQQAASTMKDDKVLETYASGLWRVAGAGAAEMMNAWKTGIVGSTKPRDLTAKQ